MNIRLSHETSEKTELLTEIKRQQEVMDEMSSKHQELVDDVMAREDEVVKLEDKLTELSYQVEEQKAVDDAVEKSKILERYQRLVHTPPPPPPTLPLLSTKPLSTFLDFYTHSFLW